MNELKICKMNEKEFADWKAHSRKNYASEKQKEGLSPEDAMAESEASFQRHLPNGVDTENHYLYSVKLDGALAGVLWWAVKNQGTRKAAWIYDIELKPEFRGKGLGKRTMELAQRDVKEKGIDRLGLHVFGHNKIAQGLYASLGFETTNLVMYKDL